MLKALTIINPNAQARLGQLQSIDFEKLASDLEQILTECESIEWSVLAGDISFNDDTAKGGGTYWQVHYHGFAILNDKTAVQRVLRRHLPSTESVSRPVLIEEFDGTSYGASYAFKPDGYRRVAYWDANAKNPCWNTLSPPPALRPREHVEFLLAMHEMGFANRLLLHSIKPVSKGNRVVLQKLE